MTAQKIVFGLVLFLAIGITWLPDQATAEKLKLNKNLMDYLAGEPVINRGSDEVLTLLPEENFDLIKAGAALYSDHCAVCHGDQLQGQPDWSSRTDNGLLPAPPHDDTGHTWHHADDQLFEIVKYGPAIAMDDLQYRSIMPAFESTLRDDEIISVLLFIRSRWTDEHRQWQKGANDAQTGKQWWKEQAD